MRHEAKASRTTTLRRFHQAFSRQGTPTTLPLFLQNSRRDILATVLVARGWIFVCHFCRQRISEPVAEYAYTQQDWYRKAVQADGKIVFISSHPQDYLSDISNRKVFSVARLIKDPDTRQPLGVIMADADTVVLARIVNDISFNVSSIVCIFDAENKLLYASKFCRTIYKGKSWKEDDIRSAGDPFTISKPISPAQWEVVVLSNARSRRRRAGCMSRELCLQPPGWLSPSCSSSAYHAGSSILFKT
jgi:two-component system sensor histidine kinase YesM